MRKLIDCFTKSLLLYYLLISGHGKAEVERTPMEPLSSDEPSQRLRLPEVDISGNFDVEKIAFAIQESVATNGAILIRVVEAEQIFERAFLAMHNLFRIDGYEKRNLSISKGGFTRGFILPGGESGSAKLKEVKEAFSVGKEWPRSENSFKNELEGHNVWPTSLEARDRSALIELYELLSAISLSLVRVVSRLLNVEEDKMLEKCNEGERVSLLRLFHYFAKTDSHFLNNCFNNQCIGSSPHTDWGFLTIVVMERNDDALEILENGKWTKLSNTPNISSRFKVLVNFGDYLALYANGRVKSPLHRVVLGPYDRYSFVYFFYPNYNTKLSLTARGKQEYLSLLKNQKKTYSEESASLSDFIPSFGEYIKNKWVQVFRKEQLKGKDEL